jgi:excisionase family DNA binding protein
MTAHEPDEDAPLLRPVKKTARRLGIGVSTTWKLIADGKLEVKRIGRRTLVTNDSIKRFLESVP